jgi:hypothetical protein
LHTEEGECKFLVKSSLEDPCSLTVALALRSFFLECQNRYERIVSLPR